MTALQIVRRQFEESSDRLREQLECSLLAEAAARLKQELADIGAELDRATREFAERIGKARA